MKTYLKGSFWKRLVALIIDELTILVSLFILFFILDLLGIKTKGIIDKIIFWIFSVVYNFVLIYKSGATFGKKLLRLRVVNAEYKSISLSQALNREFGKMINTTFLFFLGYLQVLRNPQRQAWHDKTAKTYVVAINNNGELIPAQEETISKKDKIVFWLLFLIAITPFLLAFFVIIYLFFAQPNQIKGNAMFPNYVDGQYYITLKIYNEFERGNTIVFKSPNNPELDNFKRIVGLPGEKIMISDGKVYINENVLEEAYLQSGTTTRSGNFLQEGQKITVPQGQYFVLGDNRDHSLDSREVGFIPKQNILGKMTICYWNCNSLK